MTEITQDFTPAELAEFSRSSTPSAAEIGLDLHWEGAEGLAPRSSGGLVDV